MTDDRLPSVSVVVPVRNEVRAVGGAVRSALAQDYAGVLECVVADGMSTDGTRQVVAAIAAQDPRVRVVDNPAGTTPAALNAAIRSATGRVIVRCDAHAVLPQGYVRSAVEVLLSSGADNVGGVQDATGSGAVQRAVAIAMTHPMGVGDARFHLGGPPGPVDTVYLGVFRREALERVGGFDERLLRNQDSELNHRIRQTGGTVYFHPDLRVGYEPRASLGALWRQYWGSGAWKRKTLRRSPRALRWRQLPPPLLVLALAASAGLAATPAWALALVVPALYAAALLATALTAWVTRRDTAAILLVAVLPVMHLGWGTGFLLGRARPPI